MIANTVVIQLKRGKMNRRFIQVVFYFILFSYLKNFTIITLYNVCVVPWGIHDALGDTLMHVGEHHEYHGWCSVPWGY